MTCGLDFSNCGNVPMDLCRQVQRPWYQFPSKALVITGLIGVLQAPVVVYSVLHCVP